MIFDKWTAYRRALLGGVLMLLLFQSIWIFSKVTIGSFVELTHGSGRFKSVNSVKVKYQVNFIEYQDSYLLNDFSSLDGSVPIRYLIFSHSTSRLDSFMGNWGNSIVILFVYCLIITFIFLHKDIIPKDSRLKIIARLPFIVVEK